ncbi:MAG TPA: outer membrane beta-barrel protein, partial [Thermoanaerobaculia bacterium]|nr:outer membrane beta-barrel protein [Thermoanaerobaculia bacterium]
PLDLELTGRRRISYSLSAESPYYVETAYRAGLKLRIGARVTLGAFGELGTNRYPSLAATGGVRRSDDAKVYGGTATIVFTRNVSANAFFTRSRYDSNIDTVDRRYDQFGVGITVGGDFLR